MAPMLVHACVSICNDLDKFIARQGQGDFTNCNGKYCCETSLPTYLTEYNATIENLIITNHTMKSSNPCSYAMVASLQSYYDYQNDYTYQYPDTILEMKNLHHVPAVLDWEIPKNMLINSTQLLGGRVNSSSSYCNTTNVTSSRPGWRCLCIDSFYDNPYIAGGCVGNENHARETPTHTNHNKVVK